MPLHLILGHRPLYPRLRPRADCALPAAGAVTAPLCAPASDVLGRAVSALVFAGVAEDVLPPTPVQLARR